MNRRRNADDVALRRRLFFSLLRMPTIISWRSLKIMTLMHTNNIINRRQPQFWRQSKVWYCFTAAYWEGDAFSSKEISGHPIPTCRIIVPIITWCCPYLDSNNLVDSIKTFSYWQILSYLHPQFRAQVLSRF